MEQDLPSSLIFHNRYFNLRNAKYIVKTLIIFYGTNTGAKLQPIYNFLAWTSFIEGDSGALNKDCLKLTTMSTEHLQVDRRSKGKKKDMS